MQPLAAAALGAALLFGLPAANAQGTPQKAPQTQAQPAPAMPNISDQKLDAAAAALEHVAGLQQKYEQQIAKASPADKQRLVGEADNAMEKAVTDQGLSVDEYNSILEVAQNNPSIRAKLLQRIQSSGD
jgi:hypothetical protein